MNILCWFLGHNLTGIHEMVEDGKPSYIESGIREWYPRGRDCSWVDFKEVVVLTRGEILKTGYLGSMWSSSLMILTGWACRRCLEFIPILYDLNGLALKDRYMNLYWKIRAWKTMFNKGGNK